jgi:uncharacterized Zn-binding protein involved in type VI secretion
MAEVVRANVDTHEGHDSDSPAPFHKTAYKEPGIKVFANGEQVIREGDTTDCGDPAVGNISTVFAEGKPLHLKGHATGGHGSFVANKAQTGSSDVFADNLFNVAVNITPEHEAYLREGPATRVVASDRLEYGDGGIPNGDGEFLANNTSPVTGETGPRQTPSNTSSFRRTSDPQLNFLPHTDPTLEPELENKLISLARDWGQTLVITSAYRSPAYNAKLEGAADTSFHVGRPFGSGKAMACDIVMSNYSLSDRVVFIEKAVLNGLRGIGIYNTFIHVDIGPKRCWASNGTRRSMPSRCPWARPILQKYGYATGPN